MAEHQQVTFSITIKPFADQVESTALKLAPEARLQFLNDVLALLSDARVELIDSAESRTFTADNHYVIPTSFAGLDELCAAALLAGGAEAPHGNNF
ncbi:hypothetical protein HK44_020500 [Pseudomonas fluorescens HK44]|uniref:Uncharacterized protein n=1 Tax=Pseudomonas fluorescens HK44 TaxID=1042209 RepID=A0A010S755_PSEFL|nr:hypothetical protein [Pseudomonas fluorescens]EXF96279.1 hypothetical protein HK44_020500 [Pseudomonas fluorescens HK44]